ncbi:MAG: glycosyltransferase family 39 protein [Proteobacteria bacterium]|nr:glycosyltransferase family 39 protein [Pseudomonadota bacterium]
MTSLRSPSAGTPARADRRGGTGCHWREASLLFGWTLLLWSVCGLATCRAPQLDSAEQFVWSISLQNGYWKHPPLPSWLMHALVAGFGPSVTLPLVATQAGVVIALLLVLRLGCATLGAPRALAGVALTSLVTYYNVGADSFNHTTVLLPFLAALMLASHAAVRRGGAHRWALVGLCAGLAMLVKYLAALHIAALLVYLVLDREQHRRATLVGLAVAGGVALLTLLPHLRWLETHDFLPLQYARSMTLASASVVALLLSLADFVLIQGLRLLPFLAAAAWALRRRAGEADAPAAAPVSGADRLFLWTLGTVPLLLEIGFALATRAELQSRWGSADFLLVGLMLLSLRRPTLGAAAPRRALLAAMLLQALLALGSLLGQTVLADHLHRRTRANFPGAVLAEHAQRTWAAHTSAPLRLVVSDIWLGGNLVLHNQPRRIAVLIDGRHYMSPWVRESAVEDCGALVMDDLSDDAAGRARSDPALQALFARADASGLWTLPWADGATDRTGRPRGLVRWAIVLPAPGHACPAAQGAVVSEP